VPHGRSFPPSRILLAVAAVALLAPVAHPCDSTGCLLTTKGDSGLLRRHGVRLDVSFRATSLDTPLAGSTRVGEVRRPWADTINGQIWPAFHRDDASRERFVQMDAAYGLSSRVSLFTSAPLLAQRSFRLVHGTLSPVSYSYSTRGFGDVVAGARVGLLRGPRPLVASVAVKLPTGDSDVRERGAILDPMGQPGSGSTDLLVSAQYSWAWKGLAWSAAASRQQTGTSARGYAYGDETIASAAASRLLRGPLGASLQAKVFHKTRSTLLGQEVPATGGTAVYLTPGLRLAARDGLSLYALVPVPVYRYVYENQLGPSVGILLGAAKTF
jgi:hypothetical protein